MWGAQPLPSGNKSTLSPGASGYFSKYRQLSDMRRNAKHSAEFAFPRWRRWNDVFKVMISDFSVFRCPFSSDEDVP